MPRETIWLPGSPVPEDSCSRHAARNNMATRKCRVGRLPLPACRGPLRSVRFDPVVIPFRPNHRPPTPARPGSRRGAQRSDPQHRPEAPPTPPRPAPGPRPRCPRPHHVFPWDPSPPPETVPPTALFRPRSKPPAPPFSPPPPPQPRRAPFLPPPQPRPTPFPPPHHSPSAPPVPTTSPAPVLRSSPPSRCTAIPPPGAVSPGPGRPGCAALPRTLPSAGTPERGPPLGPLTSPAVRPQRRSRRAVLSGGSVVPDRPLRELPPDCGPSPGACLPRPSVPPAPPGAWSSPGAHSCSPSGTRGRELPSAPSGTAGAARAAETLQLLRSNTWERVCHGARCQHASPYPVTPEESSPHQRSSVRGEGSAPAAALDAAGV
ncbi:uncharacterized protein [Struthio camelus]|uniref:uncharacterized protein n=1 Tax=Struthio camelus TaxID=8801 RepID=UPI0036040DB7